MIEPGDSGPCPICGEEMAEKSYKVELLGIDELQEVRGRYWHMSEEHGILEQYDANRE